MESANVNALKVHSEEVAKEWSLLKLVLVESYLCEYEKKSDLDFQSTVWDKNAGATPTSVQAGKVWAGSTQTEQPQNPNWDFFSPATCWQSFPSVALKVVRLKKIKKGI